MPGITDKQFASELPGHWITEGETASPFLRPTSCNIVKRFKSAALLLSIGILTTGCVGGPGSYFESVSREKVQTTSTPQPDLAVTAVESTTLVEPGADSSAVSNENSATALGEVQETNQQLAGQPQPLTGLDSEPPLQIGLVQTNSGDVLLLPREESSAYGDLENVTNAYAVPSDNQASSAQSLAPPALASLAPGTSLLSNDSLTGFAIGSETPVTIDPLEAAAQARIPLLDASIDHGQCKGGFGPKPKKTGAKRINPGDPFYIEIRMRQTPLLPVGHTYVAYGRLGANGEPIDEKLIMLAPVGGYAGAALASGIPMPGILTPHRDDCRIRPDLGYRVSLNAQRYEKLLQEVRKAKEEKPSYLLLAYNCNHFMTRIAGSVGIQPPKNIYLPAVQYLHAMIERNEGIKVSRR